jgi:hypothetical protein
MTSIFLHAARVGAQAVFDDRKSGATTGSQAGLRYSSPRLLKLAWPLRPITRWSGMGDAQRLGRRLDLARHLDVVA